MTDLLAIGNIIRDAYNSSIADGHAAWRDHVADGLQVYHVPELPGDGTPVDLRMLGDAGQAETDALGKLDTRITVETVRQAGDDTVILETTFTGALPNGTRFRFPNVLMYTFRDGKIVGLVEVASAEMWSTLQAALRAVASGSVD